MTTPGPTPTPRSNSGRIGIDATLSSARPQLRTFAFVATAIVLTVIAGDVEGAGLSLPAPDLFAAAGEATDTPLHAPGWTCSPPETTRCDCVPFVRGDFSVFLLEIDEASDDALRADEVVVVGPDSVLVADHLTATGDGRQTSVSLGPGIWVRDGESSLQLRFASATFELDGKQLTSSSLRHLRWESAATRPVAVESCDDIAELSAAVSEDGAALDRWATATGATRVDDRWSVSGLDLAGIPSPGLPSSIPADEPLNGFLPPAIFVSSQGARLTGSYHLADPAVSLRAHIDSAPVAGAGIGRWSRSPLCSRDLCRARPLYFDLYAGPEGFDTAHIGGQFGAGDPRHHVTASTDGLSAGASDYDPGQLERLSHDAFFRQWSMHRTGASFGGPNHDLFVGAALAHQGSGSFDVTDRFASTTRLWVDYGTRLTIGNASHADLRVQHAEFDIGDDEAGRLTRLSLGVDRTLGSPNRAFLRPALRGEMITEVADTSEGAEAGSRGQFDALIDGGLAIRGQLASLDHVITPRAFIGRRLFAEDALPARLPPTRAGRKALYPPGPFHFAGVALDQHLRSSHGRRLRFPLSTVAVDDGRGSDWIIDSRATVEYTSSDSASPVVVGLDTRCVDGCDASGIQARLQLSWTDAVETVHVAGRGVALHPAALSLDRRIRTGASRWHTPTPDPFAGGGANFFSSSLRGQSSHWDAELRLLGELRSPSEGGLALTVERFWPQLGWGVALQTAAMGHDSQWVTMLGLRNSPAF